MTTPGHASGRGVCQRNGIPLWCGGMLESGVGRAYNVALASLPNFTLPGDEIASLESILEVLQRKAPTVPIASSKAATVDDVARAEALSRPPTAGP